jgi:hypothetical protein
MAARWLLVLAVLAVACNKQSSHAPPEHTGSAAPLDRGSAAPDADQVFWKWFVDHADALSKAQLVDVMNQVQEALDKGHHGVFAEVGQDGDSRLLVLTADGDRAVFPDVQHLISGRPELKGWKIVAFRQRDTERDMPTLEMGGVKLERSAVRFVAQRSEDKLDVQLFIPGYVDGQKKLGSLAFLALDHTVGEYDAETKIGALDLLPIERAPANARPLAELPAQVDAPASAPR